MRPKSAQNQQTAVAWIVGTPPNRSIYAADAARGTPSPTTQREGKRQSHGSQVQEVGLP